ncbi:dual serine/threonine and tyrosine protein kinase-like [Antedon mediterranea]|uniref:dual serine/threonine and tyrosine protein kinase-like n=1 Tax=Antedon mediterranea TaxID=105859 RepID=UPI003AF98E7F
MAVNLPSEFRKFAKLTEQLHQILCNSKLSLAELQSSDHFTEDQLSALRLSTEDEQAVHDIIDKHPCIVVFGQTCATKAAIVNTLFEKKILPLVEEQPDYSWRMIRFKYGKQTSLSLTLPNSFEVLNENEAFDTEWTVIPKEEVELKGALRHDPYVASAIVDITLNSSLLIGGNQVIVAPHLVPNLDITQVYDKCQEGILPIVFYGINDELLPHADLSDLLDLRACLLDIPVLFIKTKKHNVTTNGVVNINPGVTNSNHYLGSQSAPTTPVDTSPRPTNRTGRVRSPFFKPKEKKSQTTPRIYTTSQNGLGLSQQLHNIGFLRTTSTLQSRLRTNINNSATSRLLDDLKNTGGIIMFVKNTLQLYLIKSTTAMQNMHMQSMNMFITTAFDMAREIQITPKRIDYARQQEEELYKKLLEIASQKQEEIKHLISETISKMKESLLVEAECYQFVGIQIPKKGEVRNPKEIKRCQQQIQELVLNRVNAAVVEKLIGSVDYLRESFVGTLTRCLENLEQADSERESSASMALRQILNAAYQVEVTARTSSSFIRVIWERMKEIVKTMPWKNPPKVDADWRKKVALEMISSLSESKLAKSMTSQFRSRLQHSHDAFSASLKQLELRHSGRLEKKEEQRMKVRKVHAPKLARLALDSTSLRDTVLFGVPQLGREIGRGQYGVVYSCESWGGYSPCAVKSVVPPDDKHWNDLALEFHYTRSIPEHDRVVALRGSVVDHNYGGGYSPAVLLLMDRMQRDLHAAIKGNLDFPSRLQVACDVVEGLRYLHSLGLVHRDVKLKNVLLDKKNRGKITDLGFCKPEAMMSGSIVGTPIHMAPELFSGKYDNSVDVYAFGILLWYVCAGHVKLPIAFEQCHNKDHLWSSVKKGVRPEKLPVFGDKSWSLMSSCWAGEKDKRPLLGEVQDRLIVIHNHAVEIENTTTKRNDTM